MISVDVQFEILEWTAQPGRGIGSSERAERYGTELLRLSKLSRYAHGGLGVDDVLAVASNAANPLHDYFEWDDSAAANLYRRRQVRDLISGLYVRVRTAVADTETRAFVSLFVAEPGPPVAVGETAPALRLERKYIPLEVVDSDQKLVRQNIRQSRKELACWLRKWNGRHDDEELHYMCKHVRMALA